MSAVAGDAGGSFVRGARGMMSMDGLKDRRTDGSIDRSIHPFIHSRTSASRHAEASAAFDPSFVVTPVLPNPPVPRSVSSKSSHSTTSGVTMRSE